MQISSQVDVTYIKNDKIPIFNEYFVLKCLEKLQISYKHASRNFANSDSSPNPIPTVSFTDLDRYQRADYFESILTTLEAE